MGKFSTEERDKLYALFMVDEHEIREGATSKDKKKIQWFTYVRREALIMRLDTLFFGEWESGFVDHTNPYQYHQTHVDCAMYITIRGMRREYNGSQDGGGVNGAKGAATDAFKRVASQWGIGLYLQQSPQIWTENYKDENGKPDWKKKDKAEAEAMAKVADWLKQLGATGNAMKSTDSEGDDEEQSPPPASGNAGSGSPDALENQLAPNEVIWKQWVFNGSTFLYTHHGEYNQFEHKASLKKRQADTGNLGINPSMTLYETLNRLIRYRALHDMFIDSGDYQSIFGSTLDEYVDKFSHVQAWERINDWYAAQTNTPAAQPKKAS